MFLEHVLTAGLLPSNPETNVLRDFQLTVKKTLVSQVVTFLRDPSTRPGILTTLSHVRWMLETCGQGFTLPLEEEATILAVVELYRRWALEPSFRPPCVDEQGALQSFYQDLLMHLSLAFQPRALPAQLDKHVALCTRVLEIYLDFGRQFGRILSLETWETFLRLIIGIADSLLSPLTTDDNLGKKLCPKILKVTFELWLHSRTRNPTLWEALKALVPNWFHHDRFIEQWNSTTLALTMRSLAIMYSLDQEKDTGVTLVRDDTYVMKMDDDYVYYSWYRILYIIGNPNLLRHPPIFLHAFQGIEKLVQQYLSVGSTEKGKILQPDGNTILHIFGHWLFEAIQQDRSGFDEGTALAVKILCNIVCTRPYSKYLPVYLGSFCTCISEALKKEGRVLISAIMHCQELFTYEIEGCRVLVPFFIHAIGRILQKKVSSFDHIEQGEVVRRACVKILYTLFALPNHFANAPFHLKTPGNFATPLLNVLEVENFLQLKGYLNQILLDALKFETCGVNIQQLLYVVFVWGLEDLPHSSDFTKQALSLLLTRTVSLAWPTEVSLTALKVITMMVSFYPLLDTPNEQANNVVSKLCKYIIAQCDRLDAEREAVQELEALVWEAFSGVGGWVLIDSQWILEDRELIQQVLRAIVVGLSGKEIEKKTDRKKDSKDDTKTSKKQLLLSEKFHEAADSLLLQMLAHLANFPPASGAHRLSTLVNEEDLLLDSCIKGNWQPQLSRYSIRYFSMENNSIVTLIDRPFENGGPATTLIVRDKTGKYAWNSRQSFLKLALQNLPPLRPPSLDARQVATEPFISSSPETDPSTLTELNAFFDKKKEGLLVSLSAKQVTAEKALLTKKNFGLEADIAVTPPELESVYIGDNKLHQSRLLLTHLGFISPLNRHHLILLEQSPQFFRNLKILDTNLSEREAIRVTVVYVGRGQTTEAEFSNNLGGSIDYQEFVSSLGWGVDTKGQEGVVYYSTYNTEVFFQVATLLPNSDKDENAVKRRQINSTTVSIVWTEDNDSFRPNYSLKPYPSVHIVIHPLSYRLYRIRIFQRIEAGFGPLLDGMVVSKQTLGALVRETAISAFRAGAGTTQTPLYKREKLLSETIKLYKKDPKQPGRTGDPAAYVAAYGVFCNLPNGETSPVPSDKAVASLPPPSPFPAYPYPSMATIQHYSLLSKDSSNSPNSSNSNMNTNPPSPTTPAPSSSNPPTGQGSPQQSHPLTNSGSSGSISISASRSPRVGLGNSPRTSTSASSAAFSRSPLSRP